MANFFVSQSLSFHLILDPSSARILASSQGANKLLGYSSAELQSRSILDISVDLSFASFSNIVKCLYSKTEQILHFHSTLQKNLNSNNHHNSRMFRCLQCTHMPNNYLELVEDTDWNKSSSTEKLFSQKVCMIIDFQLLEFECKSELIVTGHPIPKDFIQKHCKLHPYLDKIPPSYFGLTPHMLFLIDCEGRYLLANKAISKVIHELSKEEINSEDQKSKSSLKSLSQNQFHSCSIKVPTGNEQTECEPNEKIISVPKSKQKQGFTDFTELKRMLSAVKIPFRTRYTLHYLHKTQMLSLMWYLCQSS
jgi:hypothetical protein